MSEEIITIEELDKIPYGELKLKFEQLGVSHVWKHGEKKAVLMAKAIEALKEIKEGVAQKEIEEEEIPHKVEGDVSGMKNVVTDVQEPQLVPAEPEGGLVGAVYQNTVDVTVDPDQLVEPKLVSNNPELPTVELIQPVVKKPKVVEVKVVEKPRIPKAVLEQNLARIQRDLPKCLPTHRDILIKKQNEIMKMLKEY